MINEQFKSVKHLASQTIGHFLGSSFGERAAALQWLHASDHVVLIREEFSSTSFNLSCLTLICFLTDIYTALCFFLF